VRREHGGLDAVNAMQIYIDLVDLRRLDQLMFVIGDALMPNWLDPGVIAT
jgi:hypothetical protein